MKISTTRAGVAVALLAAAALIPTLASATTDSTAMQSAHETVKFGDLDLNRRSDTKILLNRIREAAVHVCSMNGYIAQPVCYRKAVREAVQQINRPQLSAAL
jgi:UrcA family protein